MGGFMYKGYKLIELNNSIYIVGIGRASSVNKAKRLIDLITKGK